MLAQALFDEGRALMAQRRWAPACAKLEESNRLDPLPGVLLNLAVCHEGQGRTATAWTELKEALALARADGRKDRQELAETHLSALEPLLARLAVEVPADVAALPGLAVLRDDSPLRAAAWGISAPVDPGEHVIAVTATGYVTWQATVDAKEGTTRHVVVAPLARTSLGDTRVIPRRAGWALASLGAASVLAGAAAGVYALVEEHAAAGGCSATICRDAASLAASGRAGTAGTATNVLLGGGFPLTAVGALLVVLSPAERAAVTVSVEGPRLVVTGGF